ncbi:hypothetical protein K502DRAFT_333283 [Neoconidiobolus thromboides FSU 785]|nr:hypothetical protein K502DRAFT_333283 [Neoconidiobolus thromboides FSU 785]
MLFQSLTTPKVEMVAPINFNANICGFEKANDHLWFTIVVTSNYSHLPTKSYFIKRTFSQFVKFSNQISKQCQLSTIKPAKYFLTICFMSSLQKYEEIDRYLQKFNCLDKQLLNEESIRQFFGLNEKDQDLNSFKLDQIGLKRSHTLKNKSSKKYTETDNITPLTTTTQSVDDLTSTIVTPFTSEKLDNLPQLKRTLSTNPILLRSKSLFQRQRTTIEPLSRKSSTASIESLNPAPWNKREEEANLNGVIAPWNIKNLEKKEQEIISNLKPIMIKRRSRMLLGERGIRMRDFEMSMDKLIPNEKIKVKVVLNKDQIVSLRVNRSIHYNDLVYKIRAKFLRNSYSCVSEIQNKLLVFKRENNKLFQLANDEDLNALMAIKPEQLTLALVNMDKKFLVR